MRSITVCGKCGSKDIKYLGNGKCYCNDCVHHRKDHACTIPGSTRYTPDNGFCYEASPREKEI